MSMLLPADAALFFGRFHPMVVHLPIGFLLLAAILVAISFFRKYAFLFKTLPIILLLGAISAVVSVILGLLLANEGGYQESTLAWHQWMGISVALVSILSCIWISGFSLNYFQAKSDSTNTTPDAIEQRTYKYKRQVGIVMILLFLLISVTGHLGGNLTHGDQYLFAYAPSAIQTLFVAEQNNTSGLSPFPSDPDSTLLYTHLIEPVLTKKCASCHNETKKKGGLLLSTREGLLEGGENGAVVEKGAPQNSELFKRVCLDPTNKKFMPLKGAPMSYTEIRLLNYWISSGMSFDLAVTDESIPEEIKNLIEQTYSLSTKKKSFIEKAKIPAASTAILDSLQQQGYEIKTLAAANNFLEVVAMGSLSIEKIQALLKIKTQITWLDLGHTGIQDSWLSTLNQFSNLTRLSLDNNSITDAGIAQLENFEHLESLNLHSTQVGDVGLKLLARQTNLKRLYLWQTQVTQQTVDSIRNENKMLSIDLGGVRSDAGKNK